MKSRYLNPRSGKTWPIDIALSLAPDDGGYLDLTPGDGLLAEEVNSAAIGLWRYQVAIRLPKVEGVVTLGEGWTPLLPRSWRGIPVNVKCDHLMPTGSFKDRGTAVLLNYLAQTNINAFLEDSSGNAGASMASYAQALGLKARILMPDTALPAKRAQCEFMGAEVVSVSGGREAAAEQIALQKLSTFYAGHNWQPFFIEGTKTLAFEIWEQCGYKAPDVVVVPLGQGSNLIGCHIGFGELLRRRQIEQMPRLFGVQAQNCAPYALAFCNGGQVPTDFSARPTIADGIASERPVRLPNVLSAASESGGGVISIEEEQIVAAWKEAAGMGMFVEPTGAVGLGGVTELVDRGLIRSGEKIVITTTGSGLKALDKALVEVDTRTGLSGDARSR